MRKFNDVIGRAGRVVSVLLLAQIAVFYVLAKDERVIGAATLSGVAAELGSWRQTGSEIPIEQEVLDTLKADQVLNRAYINDRGHAVSLFIAFFRSQRAGVAPHSPKVCLPGSGWMPQDSHTIRIQVPGFSEPVPVNRYTIVKGNHRSVVLYWYQSANRVVADEYAAKAYLVWDAVRYRRSDTSLVRVVIPVTGGINDDEAEKLGVDFIHNSFQPIRASLPT